MKKNQQAKLKRSNKKHYRQKERVRKIIHIYSRNYNTYFPEPGDPKYYLAGWAALQAKELKKKWPSVVQEIWRLEREVSEVQNVTVDNVLCKLFPSENRHFKYGLFPRSFIHALKKEAATNQVIVDIHFQHCLASIFLLFLLRKRPVVLHHHGSIPFRYRKKKNVLKTVINRCLSNIEERLLKCVDFCAVVSFTEKRYLEKYAALKHVVVEHGRKYFKELIPVERSFARKKLNIPLNSKVLIYVGHYYKLKGVDDLLEVFKELKAEDPLFELIMIGGQEGGENDLYKDVKQTNVLDFGRVPNDQLDIFYSASDVYILFIDDTNFRSYGGIGTACIEAMAYNIPVVSTQLIHYPGNNAGKIGEIPLNRNDLKVKILKAIKNKDKYSPRKTAKTVWDFDIILKKNVQEYKKIYESYYEQN